MMLISVKMILMIARMMMLSILLVDSPVIVMTMMAITIFVYERPDNPFSNHQIVFQSILMMIQTLYDRFDQSRPSGQ